MRYLSEVGLFILINTSHLTKFNPRLEYSFQDMNYLWNLANILLMVFQYTLFERWIKQIQIMDYYSIIIRRDVQHSTKLEPSSVYQVCICCNESYSLSKSQILKPTKLSYNKKSWWLVFGELAQWVKSSLHKHMAVELNLQHST